MLLHTLTPIKSYLIQYTEDELSALRKVLTYENSSVKYQIKRHYNNRFWKSRDPESWQKRLDSLKEELKTCLVFEDEQGVYIRPGSIPFLGEFNIQVENKIEYPKPKKFPWWKPIDLELRPYQKDSCRLMPLERHANVSLTTGCHAKGQGIIMYDGTIKKVEDIKVGDQLMGPDSSPRNVLRLCGGFGDMYKIIPTKGNSFIVNSDHILSLQRTNLGNTYLRKDGTRYAQEDGPNPILNISVHDYLCLSNNKKHIYKLYRSGINFKNTEDLLIPPYILGCWLGDGNSSGCCLTTMDEEVRKEWCEYITSIGLEVSVSTKKNSKAAMYYGRIKNGYTRSKTIENIFNLKLNHYNLINNKHIPLQYLISSKEDRFELLAGLIDTDGYVHSNHIEIIQKNNELSKNILYLARSLGLMANHTKKISRDQRGTPGEYNRIAISGNLDTINCRLERKKLKKRKQIKNVLRTGFKIEPAGQQYFFGFELDGDNLYLMDDFTVTHNSGKSAIILNTCHELGLRTCIVVPSKSIFDELSEKFIYHFGKTRIGQFGDGKKKISDKHRFIIAIGDSLANIKPDSPEYEFFQNLECLIVDESHEFAAESLEEVCHGVLSNIPYRFFLSATQFRNDGSLPLLQSIIGKTVCELSTEEAVRLGYICPHEFRIVSVESSNPTFESNEALEIKREHFLKNQNIANFTAKLINASANLGQGTLVLVQELSQIAMLLPLLKVPFAIAHSEKRKERLLELGFDKVNNAESVEKLNKNEVKCLIGTSCIATGTNIYNCHNVVNWVGGSSQIKTKQGAVGRAVRFGRSNPWASKCLPKDKAIVYDFDVEDNYILGKHLEIRIGCYMESGSGLIKYIRLKTS